MRRWPGVATRIRADWERSGLAATALGAIGFSLGIAVARVGVGETPHSAAFAKTAGFSVWSATTGFEVALWVICWTKANGIGCEIRSRLPKISVWPFIVVIVALVIALRFALLLYPTLHTPVYGMRIRQAILQIIGILAASPALFGIWRIQAWLRSPAAEIPSPLAIVQPLPGRLIADMIFARDTLKRLLFILSLMIGAVVFATGSLRSALITAGMTPSQFPAASVVLFGALFTAILALLFAPAYVELRDLQRRIRDSVSRIPNDGIPPESWYVERERLSALLQLDSSSLEAIRSVTLLLGPFFTALATLFVHDLKIQ